MKNILGFIFLILLISACITNKTLPGIKSNTSGSTSDSATISYLLKLDSKIQEAVVIGDSLLLDTVLAKDFVFTHGWNGGREDKARWRSHTTRNPLLYFYLRVDSAMVSCMGCTVVYRSCAGTNG